MYPAAVGFKRLLIGRPTGVVVGLVTRIVEKECELLAMPSLHRFFSYCTE